ncbi:MAG TPA: MHYT domain-containing protein [Xanthobacteraceae bacterium]
MFRVLSCLGGQHDLRLVALAAFVCFISSIVTVSLFQRARSVTGHARVAWIVGAGAAGGFGIWATHFIAMLAYRPSVPVAFGLTLTALSLACAAVMTSLSGAIAIMGERRWCTVLGGATIGFAVASMHFLGMGALEVPAQITWSVQLIVASILLGAVLGIVALDLAMRGNTVSTSLAASLALSAAIVTMHFTAMGAVNLIPDPTLLVTPSSIPPRELAVLIAAAAVVVLAIGVVRIDCRSAAERKEHPV